MPESGLKDMGYPGTRLLQEQVHMQKGEGKMKVSTLRLPYIFGTMPGRVHYGKCSQTLLKTKIHIFTQVGKPHQSALIK